MNKICALPVEIKVCLWGFSGISASTLQQRSNVFGILMVSAVLTTCRHEQQFFYLTFKFSTLGCLILQIQCLFFSSANLKESDWNEQHWFDYYNRPSLANIKVNLPNKMKPGCLAWLLSHFK